MSKSFFLRSFSLLACALILPATCFAGSALTIAEGGGGSFVLHGDGLSKVAVIDAAITYDASKFANPRVIEGALSKGALTAANVTAPGTVKLSVIGNGIEGSGPIMTLLFDRIGTSSGAVMALTGTLTTVKGEKLPVAYNVADTSPVTAQGAVQPAATASDTPSLNQESAAASAPASTAQPAGGKVADAAAQRTLGGSVILPAESAPSDPQPVARNQEEPAVQTGNAVQPARQEEPPAQRETEKAAQQTVVAEPQAVESVLERFRQYQRERTLTVFTDLFNRRDTSFFSQSPAAVIADGKRTVKLIISHVAGAEAPNFAFDGAQAVSLQVDGNRWVIEALPDKGALKATVTMLYKGRMQEFPLAVSPPANVDLDKSGKVTPEDFRIFVKSGGKGDINGDGKADYIDDYIFTANYLASGEIASERDGTGGARVAQAAKALK